MQGFLITNSKPDHVLAVAPKQALIDAGLEKAHHPEAYEALDKTKVGILIGSGMGGLTVFQDGVKNLVEKGYKKMSPFFIPYAITNMCARAPGCLTACECAETGTGQGFQAYCLSQTCLGRQPAPRAPGL